MWPSIYDRQGELGDEADQGNEEPVDEDKDEDKWFDLNYLPEGKLEVLPLHQKLVASLASDLGVVRLQVSRATSHLKSTQQKEVL